jgi:hypothetical protein
MKKKAAKFEQNQEGSEIPDGGVDLFGAGRLTLI